VLLSVPQLFVIFGLLLIVAELFIGIEAGFDLVLIGSILVLGGFAGIFSSTTIALIVSIALAIIYILYGRNKIKSKLILTTHKTNIDALIGKTGIVIRSITPDTAGMVRLGDEDWRATSTDTLFEKDKVEIISLEGVTLKVAKVK
jgi:membrane protein implicated in regulation of membrane protease activity